MEFSGKDVGVVWENVIVFISCHSETHRGLIPSSSIMNVDIVERDDVSLHFTRDVDRNFFKTREVSHGICCDESCHSADAVDIDGIRGGVDVEEEIRVVED
jgi:hypothetical protein